MRRRDLMLLAGGASVASLRTGVAQQPSAIPLVGVLSPGQPDGAAKEPVGAEILRQGLTELGYVDGRNIRIEARWSGGDNSRLPRLAAELAALKPDVIVANGEPAIRAAKDATVATPIVMSIVGDPVAAGFARSLAHPEGNLTGLTNLGEGLIGKRLELLRELVPRVGCIALLHNIENKALDASFLQEANEAARLLRFEPRPVAAGDPGQFDAAFAEVARQQCAAILASDPVFTMARSQLIALAARYRVAAIYDTRRFVDNGGLISYGPDLNEMFRRASLFVDKILRGARPRDLPIEQPTKLELAINLKTAKTLGITVPRSILAGADVVIE